MNARTHRIDSPATIIGRLNHEWDRMCADERTGQVVERWAQEDIRLSALGARSLHSITHVAGRPTDHHTDLLFSALLERAVERTQEGDLATRIVAQLMLPRAVITAHALRGLVGDPNDRAQMVVLAMWESIRSFPVDRRNRFITPWLAWDIHARAKRAAGTPVEIPVEDLHRYVGEPAQANASEELAKVLAWSVAEGVLTRQDAMLLERRYGDEAPQKKAWTSVGSSEQIAEATGMSAAAVRQRCSRAARKLSKAAARYIATNVF